MSCKLLQVPMQPAELWCVVQTGRMTPVFHIKTADIIMSPHLIGCHHRATVAAGQGAFVASDIL